MLGSDFERGNVLLRDALATPTTQCVCLNPRQTLLAEPFAPKPDRLLKKTKGFGNGLVLQALRNPSARSSLAEQVQPSRETHLASAAVVRTLSAMPRRTWTEIASRLALREREGLSYAELSRRSGVNPRTLTWWSWRLRKDDQGRRSDAFMQVEEAPTTLDTGIALHLGDNIVIRVARGFDGESLRQVFSETCLHSKRPSQSVLVSCLHGPVREGGAFRLAFRTESKRRSRWFQD